MVADAFGNLFSIAMAIALSPFPIVAAVLVVGNGRQAGLSFGLGWLLGLSALATVSVLVVKLVGEFGPTGQLILDWLRVVVGALLLWAALWKWQTRPKEGEGPTIPKWLQSFGTLDPVGAFRFGVALAAANPKNIALVLAAMSSLAPKASAGEAIAAILALVALGSVTVIAVVVAQAIGGSGVEPRLEAVKQFMLRNNSVILMAVFAVLGANVLGSGLYGLLT